MGHTDWQLDGHTLFLPSVSTHCTLAPLVKIPWA
jgi:hypothetical protein